MTEHDNIDDCKICRFGEISDVGATLCNKCNGGKYVNDDAIDASNHLTCKTCPVGKYSLDGFEECILCPGGKYNNENGKRINDFIFD